MNIKNYLTPTKKYKILVSSLHSIYRLFNLSFQTKDAILRLTKLFCQIFNTSYCSIILLNSNKKYSILRVTFRNQKYKIEEKKKKISSSIEKRIIRSLNIVQVKNVLGIPLISEDIIGVIIIKRKGEEDSFSDFDKNLLSVLSEQITVGLKNIQLYEEQQKLVLGSIKSLINLLDMRIPQEYTHSPYFSRLVTAIAEEMRLDEKQIESLKYASLLHDAGKIDIPIEILTKPTKLTPKEYKIIKKHPLHGARILRHIQILKPVIPIIMHHHERYDGTGYPSRLKKEKIPQGARIMAVADAFEAMVYGRPYRERKDINAAIGEIKNKSGTQFDPKVVDAFLKAIKKINLKKYLQEKNRILKSKNNEKI